MSEYNAYASQKFLEEYAASKLDSRPDATEEKKKKLEAHVARFPSSFDNTSIGTQLREHAVDVRLYAEIRDSLWENYQRRKERKASMERFLLRLRNEIDEEI